MCDVFEIAKKICEAGNWNVTNLGLQKMLYIAQILYIGETGAQLFDNSFEAWDYGPVCPEVYKRFKMFGSKPIEEWAFPILNNSCAKEKIDFIEKLARLLTNISASKLVALTHRPKTGWEKNYKPGLHGQVISFRDMQKEFEEVWAKK